MTVARVNKATNKRIVARKDKYNVRSIDRRIGT